MNNINYTVLLIDPSFLLIKKIGYGIMEGKVPKIRPLFLNCLTSSIPVLQLHELVFPTTVRSS